MNEVLRVAGAIAPFAVLAGLIGIVVWARVRRWDARVPTGFLYEVDPHATREPAAAIGSEQLPEGHHHVPGGHAGGPPPV